MNIEEKIKYRLVNYNSKESLADRIIELQNRLQQKENIIKEVREYIKDACYLDEVNYPNSLGHKQTMKILEILDKEVN